MNAIDLKGRSAVVTGAARGIGFAIVRRLLTSGARCSLWDIDRDALNDAVNSLEGQGDFDLQVVDVTRSSTVTRACANTVRRLGSIDILVNNAGLLGAAKRLWECSPEEWSQVVNVNLFGAFLCCHAVVPKMLQKGYGRIVNIASVAGKEGNPSFSHYSAAKAGVIGLTKSLGKELVQTGVLVNCITPGLVETDLVKQIMPEQIDYMMSRIPLGRRGTKEEVAALVAWLCSEECSFSTGAVFDLSGGRATY